MDKNLKWKVLLIVVVVVGFVWASFPLGEIDVRTYLEKNAVNQDAQFQELVKSLNVKYAADRQKVPLAAVQILQDKARELGLDLTRYFPGYEDNQKVLRHIARDTRRLAGLSDDQLRDMGINHGDFPLAVRYGRDRGILFSHLH